MKAMVLAAGEGTRLRPLTDNTPKALLPVNGQPMICYVLAWLKSHGITDVAVNLHHRGEKIVEFLGNGTRCGVKVSYSWEPEILGTAGGVKKMEGYFKGTFTVVYGDVLTDFNLTDMIQFHQKNKAVATLCVYQVTSAEGLGIVETDAGGRVTSFQEKPEAAAGTARLANGGIYLLEKEVLDHIPPQGSVDFAYDVLPGLLEFGLPVYAYRLKPDNYLIDIGTAAKYRAADEAVKSGEVKIKL